jgi:hypothetical protein
MRRQDLREACHDICCKGEADVLPLVTDADLRSMADELFPILLACEGCGGSGEHDDSCPTPDGGSCGYKVRCPSCAGSGHDPKVRAVLLGMLIDVNQWLGGSDEGDESDAK